jgi:hypothetical protein
MAWCAGDVSARGPVDQVSHRPPAHLVVGERDGGERRPEVGGDELLVVEADDGDVLRYAEAPLLERLVGTHGRRVVAAEDRRRRVLRPHQLRGEPVPAPRGTFAVPHRESSKGSPRAPSARLYPCSRSVAAGSPGRRFMKPTLSWPLLSRASVAVRPPDTSYCAPVAGAIVLSLGPGPLKERQKGQW